MKETPLSSRRKVLNLAAYFDALRASVPGMPPRRQRIDVIQLIHERARARRAQP